jgi:hypothetical protein
MADGLSDIDCTVTIEKKGSSPVTITGDVYNLKESGFVRKVNYSRTIGGLILSNVENPTFLSVEFDFITPDTTYVDLTHQGSNDWDFDSTDLYKIVIKFSDGTDFYGLLYYDCIVESLIMNINDGVLEGHIKFSLPIKNINGDTNYYHIDVSGDEATHDSTHNY